jgi:hypothetical protein
MGIETVLSVFDRLIEAVTAFNEQKLAGASLFRACFLEVNGNMELLKMLRKDESVEKNMMRDDLNNNAALLRYLCRLNITVCASILLDRKGRALGHFFKGDDFNRFLKQIAFVVERAEALKRLESLDSDEKELLRNVNIRLRIDHLFDALKELYHILKEQDGVKEVFTA